MKIAIAKDGVNVSGHFGHCEGFEVYHLESGEITKSEFLKNPGHVPGYLPKFLSENGASVIIAGGMGGSAQNLFKANAIEVVVGAQGPIEGVIKQYMDGILKSTNSVCSDHAHEGTCEGH